jgi:hypothetical protein
MYQAPSSNGQKPAYDDRTVPHEVRPPVTLRPPAPRQRVPLSMTITVAASVTVAALALAFAVLTMVSNGNYRNSVNTQIAQLNRALSTATANSSSENHKITGQVGGLAAEVGGLAPLGVYATTCSSALNGPSGAGDYYVPCTSTKP